MENTNKRDYNKYKQGQQNKPKQNFGPQQSSLGIGHVLPLEVLDKCVGRKLWILMKNDKEYFGTLTGFTDDQSNLALIMQNVKEYTYAGGNGARKFLKEMSSILLNGNHICLLIPGDDEPRPKAVNE